MRITCLFVCVFLTAIPLLVTSNGVSAQMQSEFANPPASGMNMEEALAQIAYIPDCKIPEGVSIAYNHRMLR